MPQMYFKSTNEAVKYGREHKGDTEVIRELGFALKENEAIKDMAKREAENAVSADLIPKEQEYLNLICKCQFIKEALEEATGERIKQEGI